MFVNFIQEILEETSYGKKMFIGLLKLIASFQIQLSLFYYIREKF